MYVSVQRQNGSRERIMSDRYPWLLQYIFDPIFGWWQNIIVLKLTHHWSSSINKIKLSCKCDRPATIITETELVLSWRKWRILAETWWVLRNEHKANSKSSLHYSLLRDNCRFQVLWWHLCGGIFLFGSICEIIIKRRRSNSNYLLYTRL